MAFDVMDVFVKIGADTSGLESGIEKSRGLVSGLGSAISTGMKVAGAAVVGAATAVTAFGASAVKSYASYEQLVGGVDKLYGDASSKLQAYADQAFKTSGMSANNYMETATSFSAALINSLEGDVEKAADMTDVAMRAISDNVNVFGSDMGSVTNAFQGFAKQNYTMLDNLKLGYGGTKQEMERLIEDANEYRASIGQAADLSIESFADVVQAIQSVQEAQNIAGTTNKEAMTTIEGSAAATKAAWENVITAIGRGEGLSEAFDGLVTSIFGEKEGEGLLNQIIPRIETTMEGIGDFIATASPYISDKLPALISAVVPNAIEAGLQLISAIGQGITDNIDTLLFAIGDVAEMMLDGLLEATVNSGQALADIIDWIVGVFEENYTGFIDVGVQILTNIISGFGNATRTIIPTVVDLVFTIAEKLIENVPLVIDAGIKLIQGLVDGIFSAVPLLIRWIPSIIETLVDAIVEAIPLLIDGGIELVTGIVEALPTIITALIEAIPQVIDALIDGFLTAMPALIEGAIQLTLALVTALPQIMKAMYDAIPMIIQTLADAAITNLPLLIDGLVQMVSMIVANLPTIVMALIQAIPQIFQMAFDAIMTAAPMIFEAVTSILTTVGSSLMEHGSVLLNTIVQWLSQLPTQMAYWAGFAIGSFIKFFIELPSNLVKIFNEVVNKLITFGVNMKNKAVEAARNFKSSLIDGVRDLPSKFMEIGKNIVTGIWNGISSGWSWLTGKVSELANSLLQGAKNALGIASPSKEFAWVGRMVDEGFAKGLEDYAHLVKGAFDDIISMPTLDMNPTLAFEGAGAGEAGYNQVINIYSPTALDASEVARQTRNATRDMVLELRGKR